MLSIHTIKGSVDLIHIGRLTFSPHLRVSVAHSGIYECRPSNSPPANVSLLVLEGDKICWVMRSRQHLHFLRCFWKVIMKSIPGHNNFSSFFLLYYCLFSQMCWPTGELHAAMQSNFAQSVSPKPAPLLFLLLLLLLQTLPLLLHLPTTFSYFSNPTLSSSESIAWQPLQTSSQPSSQVPHHNKPTLALFPLPTPQAPPLSQYSIYLTFSYFSDNILKQKATRNKRMLRRWMLAKYCPEACEP